MDKDLEAALQRAIDEAITEGVGPESFVTVLEVLGGGDADSAYGAASALHGAADDFRAGYLGAIDSIGNNLVGWSGDAADNFKKYVEGLHTSLDGYGSAMDDMSDVMTIHKTLVEQTQADLTTLYNSTADAFAEKKSSESPLGIIGAVLGALASLTNPVGLVAGIISTVSAAKDIMIAGTSTAEIMVSYQSSVENIAATIEELNGKLKEAIGEILKNVDEADLEGPSIADPGQPFEPSEFTVSPDVLDDDGVPGDPTPHVDTAPLIEDPNIDRDDGEGVPDVNGGKNSD